MSVVVPLILRYDTNTKMVVAFLEVTLHACPPSNTEGVIPKLDPFSVKEPPPDVGKLGGVNDNNEGGA